MASGHSSLMGTMGKPIGGYFELELPLGRGQYHQSAINLNSARNCLECILIYRRWRKIFIPYYSCDAILQPILRQGLKFEFYRVNASLDPVELPRLKRDEVFLYTNYFGIKQNTVNRLACIYDQHLIVDNAQAFYAPRIKEVDTFYSPRKFFGVPDGGHLFIESPVDLSMEQDDSSWSRALHLLRRIDQGAEMGYKGFRESEDSMDYAPIKKMSKLTERLLESIDYPRIADVRRENFQMIHEALHNQNMISFESRIDDVPMVYPFLSNHGKHLRESLLYNHIYVAKYWDSVKKSCTSGLEFLMVDDLLPIPIDQRLGNNEINRIIEIIHRYE